MASSEHEGGQQPDPKARLMHEVAQQMEAIEADFGDDFGIGSIITIVEIQRPNGQVGVRVRNSGPFHTALGMLELAKKTIEGQAAG